VTFSGFELEFGLFGRKIRLDKFDFSFLAVLAVILFLQFNFLSSLKQLPSPIYGGDYYNGLGGVVHLLDGGDVLSSAQMAGEHPWVPWLYHLLVSMFAKITSLDPAHAVIWSGFIIEILASVTVYALLNRFKCHKAVSLAAAILINMYFPVFKYSDFSTYFVLPAFVLSMVYFLENQSPKRVLLAGLFLGICALSNTQAFFVSNIFLVVLFVLRAYSLGYIHSGMVSDAKARDFVKSFALVFIIGFAIALLFWFKPLFLFRGSTPNDIQNITSPDFRVPSILWKQIFELFNSLLFPYGTSFPNVLLSVLSLVGIYASVRTLKTSIPSLLTVTALLTQAIGILHPLVTLPLFNIHLMNFMMADRIAIITAILLWANGAMFILSKISSSSKYVSYVFFIALFAASVLMFNTAYSSLEKNQWMQVGKTALPDSYSEFATWVRMNTNVNDVMLTTNEDGFMLNALTGRKILSYRRAHASPYIDMHQRMLDQAVIVYGTDDGERVKLLKKYNVKYLLWTNRWIFNEFSINEQGTMSGFFDPLNVPDNATNRYYWDSNGVSYLEATMPLDPAPRDNVPMYKMIIAFPKSPNIDVPYSSELLNHFKLVKTISEQGVELFRVYEFTG